MIARIAGSLLEFQNGILRPSHCCVNFTQNEALNQKFWFDLEGLGQLVTRLSLFSHPVVDHPRTVGPNRRERIELRSLQHQLDSLIQTTLDCGGVTEAHISPRITRAYFHGTVKSFFRLHPVPVIK